MLGAMMIRLEVIQGQDKGRTFAIEKQQTLVGRAANAGLQLNDSHLSGEHGLIFEDSGQYIYRDLRSTNGSMLLRGQKRVLLDGSDRWEAALRDGDRLLLGDATSPVILLCKMDRGADSESDARVIARRERSELPDIAQRVEASPDIGALYRAIAQIAGGLDLNQVLEGIASAVFALVGRATHVSLLLADRDDSARMVPVLARSRSASEATDPIMMSRAVVRRVLEERAAVLAANAADELGGSESIMGANIRSTIGVPLWRADTIIGVVEVDNRASSGMFSERDLEVLMVLGQQAGLAVDNAQLYAKLLVARDRVEGENTYLKRTQAAVHFDSIIGEAPKMKEIFRALERVIDTRATVCVYGETGTGKELIANAIHHQGRRRDRMFVAQNCAALPENLLESELFGHKRGAFTGADHDKKGLFEIADGGTLFLDEIAEMPLILQAKLLRVLQEGEIRAVGATRPKQVDVRIICATNRQLEKEVEAGRFRQDLFYRLMVFPITLPPLRERREDIPLLFQHFLNRYTNEMRKGVGGVSQQAANLLRAYAWPGNIRELENEVQRLVIQVDEGEIIGAEHLSSHLRQREGVLEAIGPQKGTLKEMVERIERTLLIDALKDHNNNKTQTALTLGITREGLHKKLAKYGI